MSMHINRPISQIPQFTCPISLDTTHWKSNVHISVPKWCIMIWDGYIVGFWDWSIAYLQYVSCHHHAKSWWDYNWKFTIFSLLFQVLEMIAKGAFGNVLKVRHVEDKTIYAMKVRPHFLLNQSSVIPIHTTEASAGLSVPEKPAEALVTCCGILHRSQFVLRIWTGCNFTLNKVNYLLQTIYLWIYWEYSKAYRLYHCYMALLRTMVMCV